jgi:hypothetical protein
MMETTMEATEKKINLKMTGDLEAKNVSLLFSHKDFVGIEIEMDCDMVIAAYADANFPSVMLTSNDFDYGIGQNQAKKFTKITFLDFSGFKVWAAEYSDEKLKVCLRRGTSN